MAGDQIMLTGKEFLNNQLLRENAANRQVGGRVVGCSKNNHIFPVTSDDLLAIYQEFYQEAVCREKKTKITRTDRTSSKQAAN